ncbi:zinc-dependent metalloprotease [Corynebacterium sp. 320]|uniref:zinc-dependent metalloprotease n=1 Tax=Corynebacterium TaxID=1716 RepID=UPI00125CC3BC|nr:MULTISPECIES: zinc-dependent metalloprotease [Corynebacterium]KAB1504144.1 zinc-dependent metalloprotease [Corynebacterium sp. 320]KAB1552756.1 zinc-dependent metalloprotease [Corynebacterium sp. 321]KAB1554026.1 zinc-dependent metalloprotease [Corynebacterium sp. 319]KAB3528280.1 zinc-dependent metalloprotease [Corynebacterium sp. 250]KAB3540231.1 zinc-dependent metalloprotease [Corynebacterium sp. 366]
MYNFGFGFWGPDDDNSDDGRRKNNPGGGNLGDFLNQFGAMLSGFGTDMNSPDAQGPVNYSLAERIARQHIGRAKRPTQQDSQAVAESIRLVELWLDEATVLPAGATSSVAFGPEQWLEETFATWKRIITPLADKLGDAAMGGVPEEMREQMGPMSGMMKQINGMNFGMQLGGTLGEMAKTVVTSTQWGVPLAEGNTAAIATYHLEDMAKKLGCERQEALVYLAAREAAHHRLFKHVPWLRERLILDVEEFAAGLTLDYSGIEEATRNFNPEMLNDPSKIQEMMNSLQGEDMSPKVVSSNDHARERLETSLSLVEGWVDFVVGNALAERFPQAALIGAAWSSFRQNENPMMDAMTSAMGISFNAPRADEAAELWRKLHQAVGAEKRDAVWDHPDFLPVTSDLDNPSAFIGHVTLDSDDLKDFNPISEIEKLEEELRKQQEDSDGDNDGGADGDGAENPKDS